MTALLKCLHYLVTWPFAKLSFSEGTVYCCKRLNKTFERSSVLDWKLQDVIIQQKIFVRPINLDTKCEWVAVNDIANTVELYQLIEIAQPASDNRWCENFYTLMYHNAIFVVHWLSWLSCVVLHVITFVIPNNTLLKMQRNLNQFVCLQEMADKAARICDRVKAAEKYDAERR